jgi:DNA-binding response OmpR family regulator
MERSKDLVILVADDEPSVCRLIVAVLREEHHIVLCASDGQEAAELFRQDPQSVALLLTDLAMPRKDGLELINEVRAIRPDLPVIVISENRHRYGAELDGITCIPKPFAIRQLLAEVRSALQAKNERSRGFRAAS